MKFFHPVLSGNKRFLLKFDHFGGKNCRCFFDKRWLLELRGWLGLGGEERGGYTSGKMSFCKLGWSFLDMLDVVNQVFVRQGLGIESFLWGILDFHVIVREIIV